MSLSLVRRLLAGALDAGAEHLTETDDAPQLGGLALLIALGALGLGGYVYFEIDKLREHLGNRGGVNATFNVYKNLVDKLDRRLGKVDNPEPGGPFDIAAVARVARQANERIDALQREATAGLRGAEDERADIIRRLERLDPSPPGTSALIRGHAVLRYEGGWNVRDVNGHWSALLDASTAADRILGAAVPTAGADRAIVTAADAIWIPSVTMAPWVHKFKLLADLLARRATYGETIAAVVDDAIVAWRAKTESDRQNLAEIEKLRTDVERLRGASASLGDSDPGVTTLRDYVNLLRGGGGGYGGNTPEALAVVEAIEWLLAARAVGAEQVKWSVSPPVALGQCRASEKGTVVRVDAQTPEGEFAIVPIVSFVAPATGGVFAADLIRQAYPIVLAGKVVAAPAPEGA